GGGAWRRRETQARATSCGFQFYSVADPVRWDNGNFAAFGLPPPRRFGSTLCGRQEGPKGESHDELHHPIRSGQTATIARAHAGRRVAEPASHQLVFALREGI